MTQALLIEAVRSARGRGNDQGALRALHPIDLLAQQLQALAERQPFDAGAVAGAAIGCVTQTGDQGANLARLAVLGAGWPDSVPALTLSSYCASGLSALRVAAQQALADDALAVAGGVESMSRVPMGSDRGALTHDGPRQQSLALLPIGLAADLVATLEGFDRASCDAYALASQQRATRAQADGHFASLRAVHAADGTPLLERDETPRPQTTAEVLAQRAPAFAELGQRSGLDALLCQRHGLAAIDHVHHAGNAPAMADGASAVLLASPAAAARHGLRPRARLLGVAEVAVDRTLALTGAVDATRAVLARAGLTVADVDLFEVNESFAALMLHYQRHLGVRHDQLNVDGGAIALGHAMGSTGTALVGTALDALERRGARRAVVAACGAAGLAVAALIERV